MHWPEMVIGGNWSHTTPEVCHIQSSLTCFHLIQKLKTFKKNHVTRVKVTIWLKT